MNLAAPIYSYCSFHHFDVTIVIDNYYGLDANHDSTATLFALIAFLAALFATIVDHAGIFCEQPQAHLGFQSWHLH